MANGQNIQQYEFTSDQDREAAARNGRKGGMATAKKKREQKKFRELFELLLEKKPAQPEIVEMLKKAGIESDNVTNKMAMVISMYNQTMQGNTKAFELIQNQLGEKPQESLNLNINQKLEDLIK